MLHHLFRSRAGGHVVIRSPATEQDVAHASAHQIRLVSAFPQSSHYFFRELFSGRNKDSLKAVLRA